MNFLAGISIRQLLIYVIVVLLITVATYIPAWSASESNDPLTGPVGAVSQNTPESHTTGIWLHNNHKITRQNYSLNEYGTVINTVNPSPDTEKPKANSGMLIAGVILSSPPASR